MPVTLLIFCLFDRKPAQEGSSSNFFNEERLTQSIERTFAGTAPKQKPVEVRAFSSRKFLDRAFTEALARKEEPTHIIVEGHENAKHIFIPFKGFQVGPFLRRHNLRASSPITVPQHHSSSRSVAIHHVLPPFRFQIPLRKMSTRALATMLRLSDKGL